MTEIEPDAESELDPAVEPERWSRGKLVLVVTAVGCLLCVLLIGLLSTLLVPRIARQLVVSNEGKAKAGIVRIMSAVDLYEIENNGRYPESLEELIRPDENGETYHGLRAVPLDPWGRPYVYLPPSPERETYRVLTYGADGVPGGEGLDRDLDNVMFLDGEF